jgi:hypothetical protein
MIVVLARPNRPMRPTFSVSGGEIAGPSTSRMFRRSGHRFADQNMRKDSRPVNTRNTAGKGRAPRTQEPVSPVG